MYLLPCHIESCSHLVKFFTRPLGGHRAQQCLATCNQSSGWCSPRSYWRDCQCVGFSGCMPLGFLGLSAYQQTALTCLPCDGLRKCEEPFAISILACILDAIGKIPGCLQWSMQHSTLMAHRVKLDSASICNPWLPCVWLCEVGWKRPGHFMNLQGFGASCCRCRDRGLLLGHRWVVFAFFNCFLQVLWLWTLLTSLRRHSYETCPGMVTPGIDRTHIYLAKCFHRLGRGKA